MFLTASTISSSEFSRLVAFMGFEELLDKNVSRLYKWVSASGAPATITIGNYGRIIFAVA
jgi:hypothetical protein